MAKIVMPKYSFPDVILHLLVCCYSAGKRNAYMPSWVICFIDTMELIAKEKYDIQ